MTIVMVTAYSALQDNLAQGGTNCKFYRTYEIPNVGALFQYGSARNGTGGGQWNTKTNPGEARAQIRKKINSGYDEVKPDVKFLLDLDKLNAIGGIDSARGKTFVDNLFQAASAGINQSTASGSATSTPLAASTPATITATDRINLLNAQVLEAIRLASSGEAVNAMTAAASIRDAVIVLEDDVARVRSYLSTLDTILEVV